MVENATLPEKLHPYLAELQAENARLHQMVAELLLSNQALRDSKIQWSSHPKGE